MERRLAAIFAADMVGWSRLMEADETGTLARKKRHRAELIDPKIEAHKGRIVKLTGDGMIAEFPSVVEAVRCAVTIQQQIAAREADQPEDRRIRYRVAVNLGDVIFDEGDVYGDGVNIAARLEALAEPGGIVVSGTAYDHLKANIEVGYEDLGEQQVKNIATPVRVYRVIPDGAAPVRLPRPARGRRPVLAAAAIAVLIAIAGAGWWYLQRTDVDPADPARMAYSLPDKPSIAVLPFDNLSGDAVHDYVADGLTENIISALAAVPELFVIARNSVFTYRGKPVRVRQVAEDLGVRHVLEGSVRISDRQLRVTARLVDALTGQHLWSKRYDRELDDLFAVEDEITLQIARAMQVSLTEGDLATVEARRTTDLGAWTDFVQGIGLLRRFTRADMAAARDLFEQALARDPAYVGALTALGWTHWNDARSGWGVSREDSLAKAGAAAEQALDLAPDDSGAHALLGGVHLLRHRYDEAIRSGRRAVELAPSVAENYAVLAISTFYAGEFAETERLTRTAMRLHPFHPDWYNYRIAVAQMMLGRHEEAVAAMRRWHEAATANSGRQLSLAMVLSVAGQLDEARGLIDEALAGDPSITLRSIASFHPFRDATHLERILAALRAAGVPE